MNETYNYKLSLDLWFSWGPSSIVLLVLLYFVVGVFVSWSLSKLFPLDETYVKTWSNTGTELCFLENGKAFVLLSNKKENEKYKYPDDFFIDKGYGYVKPLFKADLYKNHVFICVIFWPFRILFLMGWYFFSFILGFTSCLTEAIYKSSGQVGESPQTP